MILIPLCLATDRVKVKFPFVCFGPLWHARSPWLSFFLHTVPIQVSLWNSQKGTVHQKSIPWLQKINIFNQKKQRCKRDLLNQYTTFYPVQKQWLRSWLWTAVSPLVAGNPKGSPVSSSSCIQWWKSILEDSSAPALTSLCCHLHMQWLPGARFCIRTDFQAALVAIVTDSSSWARALWFRSPPQGCSFYSNAWWSTTASCWKWGLPHFWGKGSRQELVSSSFCHFPIHYFDHTHLEDRGWKS